MASGQKLPKSCLYYKGMTAVKKAHLRELTTLFLHEKQFVGVQGLQLTDTMCLIIAAQACLPALGFGISCLTGWTEIILYPAAFRISRDSEDASGVLHHQKQALIGESWPRGLLSCHGTMLNGTCEGFNQAAMS
jgi:MtfA peptidase